MVLTKDKMDKLATNVVEIYNGIENDMLIKAAELLGQNKDLLESDPAAWQLQMLEHLGLLDKANLKVIRDSLGITSKELNAMIYQAGLEGVEKTDEVLTKATKKGAHLLVPQPMKESQILFNIMAAYQMQAASSLNLTNQTLIDNAKVGYINVVNQMVGDILAGTKTHDKALRSAIGKWAEDGVPALIDKGGRRWGAEGYVRMIMLTTIGNTANSMQDQRMDEWGIDLIEVSSHNGARPLCAPYQGRIFSKSGSHPKYDSLESTSYGKPNGLFGINCGHIKYPYVEGISTKTYYPMPKRENDRVYEESQKQRSIERSIRKAKTREQMLMAAGDEQGAAQARQLIAQRQSSMRSFIEETGRTRRRYREQIVKTNGGE